MKIRAHLGALAVALAGCASTPQEEPASTSLEKSIRSLAANLIESAKLRTDVRTVRALQRPRSRCRGWVRGSRTAKVRDDCGVVVTDTSVNSHLLDHRVPQELREPLFVPVCMSAQCKARAQLPEGYRWHADPVGAINKLHTTDRSPN